MVIRRPVIKHYPYLIRADKLPSVRTPVIKGVPAKSIADLAEFSGELTANEIAASVELTAQGQTVDPIIGKIQQALLECSCVYFATQVLRGPTEAPYNGRFIAAKHHRRWDEIINKHKRICLLAARDHGKSFAVTFAYPIWFTCYKKPGSHILLFSATQTQAEQFLSRIKDELLNNPKLGKFVPATGDRFWSAHRITLANGSTITAIGFRVKVRGRHPDAVVCDDILGDDDIYSETIRRRNADYFLSAIAGMMRRTLPLIVIGTPLHQGDLYATLKETGEYYCESFPALDRKTGEPLFPERYSIADLKAKRRELKSEARFAREYLCQPISDEASLFPAHLFEGKARAPYILGLGHSYWAKLGCRLYTGVDIAVSAEVGADYFVIFTIAVNSQGMRYIANIRRGKGWSFSRQIDEIKEEYYLMRPEIVHIEANQAQRVWGDEIARTTDIPVRRFFTTGVGGRQPKQPWKKGATTVSVNKNHIEKGLPGLRIGLEHGKWRIPRGDERSIELTDIWMGELSSFGWINGKAQSTGEHDDVAVSSWICDAAIKMAGIDMEFLEGDEIKPLQALASPVPPKNVTADYLDQERHALAACQEKRVAQVDQQAYFARVRSAMKTYAEQLIDKGDFHRGTHTLEQISRLDSIHKFHSYDEDIARLNPDGYAEPTPETWKPVERAPSLEDLGL